MKKLKYILIGMGLMVAGTALALPVYQQTQSLLPARDGVYDLGTTSPSNLRYNGFFNNLTVSGTCTGCGGGGGTYPFTPTSAWGALAQSTTSLLAFPQGLIGTTTIGQAVIGSLTATSSVSFPAGSITDTMLASTFLKNYDAFTHPASGQSATTSLMLLNGGAKNANGDWLTQEPSYIVSTSTTDGNFTDIQSAVNALPSTGGRIAVRCGTYTVTSPLTISVNNTEITGQGSCTDVQFDASLASTSLMNVNPLVQLTQIKLENFKVTQTGTSGTGTGIDVSGFAKSVFRDVDINNVQVGMFSNGSTTLYNAFYNVNVYATSSNSYGWKFLGQSNSNNVYGSRIIVASSTEGVMVNNSISNLFNGVDVEAKGTIAFDIQTGANATQLQNVYSESNGISLKVASGVRNVIVQGGNFSNATNTEVLDLGAVGLSINNQQDSQNKSYFTGSNFAFGNSAPLKLFEVGATTTGSTAGYLRVNAPAATPSGLDLFRQGVAGWGIGTGGASTGDFNLTFNVSGNYTDANIVTASKLTVSGASGKIGNVGIGSTSPYARLSVAGNAVVGTITATTSTSTLAGLIINVGGAQISTISSCSGANALITDSSGNVGCGAITGSGAPYPFTPLTSWGALAQATTSILQMNGALISSSTIGQLTIPYLTSTSTATSTFAGGINSSLQGIFGTGLTVSAGQITAPAGTGVVYTFSGDTKTGIKQAGAGDIRFTSTNGTEIFRTSSTGAQIEINGTSALPALSAGNGTTGLFFPSSGLGFSTLGLEAGRFDSVGRLGIATTSPFAMLSVSATSTASLSNIPIFSVSTSTSNATTTAFYIDSNDNVGVATTTPGKQFSVAGAALIGGNLTVQGTLSAFQYPSFTYATSSWQSTNASTTMPLGVAYVSERWVGISCFTDSGVLGVGINDGTNYMDYFVASATPGIINFTKNQNIFTSGVKRYVDIGTTTPSQKLSCTVKKILQ